MGLLPTLSSGENVMHAHHCHLYAHSMGSWNDLLSNIQGARSRRQISLDVAGYR